MKVATSRWYARFAFSAKHDVVAITEVSPRADDDTVEEEESR